MHPPTPNRLPNTTLAVSGEACGRWCSDNNVPFPDKVAVAERVLDAVLGANPEEAAETPVFDANRLHVLTNCEPI